jgi:hypothetical protein
MGDNESNNKNIVDKAADGASFASNMVQVASTMVAAAGEIVPTLVPFVNFLPLIKEIGGIFDEIIELVEAAEHNKRTCKLLERKVQDAESAVRELKQEREVKKNFFNKKNYSCIQELCSIISRVRNFIKEISQANAFMRFVKAKNVEKNYKELCGEFDSCISSLSFSIDVKISNDLEQLKADTDDFNRVRLTIVFYCTFI